MKKNAAQDLASSDKLTTATYRPDVDGIRALAILSVVIFHVFPNILPGGFIGVDIFFVISGYLISGHIMEELHKQKFSFSNFYAKRINRIFPSLIVVLSACLVAGWLCLFTNELSELSKDIGFSTIFGANLLYWREAGYFDQPAQMKILLHLWSLGIEEQFYILWPLFLVLLWKRTNKNIWFIAFLTVVSFLGNAVYAAKHPTAIFYLPITRFWELLVGAHLAYVNIFCRERFDAFLRRIFVWPPVILNQIQSGLGLLLIGYGLFGLDRDDIYPGWAALLPTVGTFLLISGGAGAWINRAVLSRRVPVYIGLISYPLYLWHWPLIVFTRILNEKEPSTETLLCVVSASLVLAALSYEIIEKPIRSWGRVARTSRYRIAMVLLIFMAIIGSAGFAIRAHTDQIPPRFAGDNFWTGKEVGWELTPECKQNYPFPSDMCLLSKPNAPPTVALLGDSHAAHFYAGLKKYFDDKGENLLAIGSGNCPPFYDINIKISKRLKNCPSVFNPTLDRIAQSPNIHTVILSSYGISTVTGQYFGDTRNYVSLYDLENPETKSGTDIYVAGLRRTLEQLLNAGKSVVYIYDTPELNFDPITCVARRPFSVSKNLRTPCGIDRRLVDSRLGDFRKAIAATLVKFPQVMVMDPMASLCDKDYCYAETGTRLLYHDNNHLSVEGSLFLGETFGRSMDDEDQAQ